MQRFFRFYIQSSLHVALALVAMQVAVTLKAGWEVKPQVYLFGFLVTFAGYNFSKYYHLLFQANQKTELKIITTLSIVCSLIAGLFFWEESYLIKILILVMGVLTLLYVLPFFNHTNARNFYWSKTTIVALNWAIIVVAYPYFHLNSSIDSSLIYPFVEVFLLVYVLLFIFDIVDSKADTSATFPTVLGIAKTKQIGLVFLLLISVLGVLDTTNLDVKIASQLFYLLVALALLYAQTYRSQYYTRFWVEALPFVWVLLLSIALAF